MDERLRDPEQIRQSCIEKLRPVGTDAVFTAILGFLLGEVWTSYCIEEMLITPSHDVLLNGCNKGETEFKAYKGSEATLVMNLHGIAKAAGLDGDEVGYLLGKVAGLKAD